MKKVNQCPYTVFGFHRYDLVKFNKSLCYINSLRTAGSFVLKDLEDSKFTKEVNYKKLTKFQGRDGYITKLVKVL